MTNDQLKDIRDKAEESFKHIDGRMQQWSNEASGVVLWTVVTLFGFGLAGAVTFAEASLFYTNYAVVFPPVAGDPIDEHTLAFPLACLIVGSGYIAAHALMHRMPALRPPVYIVGVIFVGLFYVGLSGLNAGTLTGAFADSLIEMQQGGEVIDLDGELGGPAMPDWLVALFQTMGIGGFAAAVASAPILGLLFVDVILSVTRPALTKAAGGMSAFLELMERGPRYRRMRKAFFEEIAQYKALLLSAPTPESSAVRFYGLVYAPALAKARMALAILEHAPARERSRYHIDENLLRQQITELEKIDGALLGYAATHACWPAAVGQS